MIVDEGCLAAAVRFLLRGSLVAQEYSAGLLLNLATNRYSFRHKSDAHSLNFTASICLLSKSA